MYPFYYILIFSLSDSIEAARGVTFLPRGFTLANYRLVFGIHGIARATAVSVVRTVSGTAITLFACSFFAYLMTQQQMYFRKIVYRFMIVSMYVGAGLIPTFLVMRMYGLNNNFLIYILPGALGAFNVILIKTYIEQLPPALEEAAFIDGAGFFKIYAWVIYPLCMPINATIIVFTSVGHWNEWFSSLIYMVGRPDLHVLQFRLFELLTRTHGMVTAETDPATLEQMVTRITPETVRMTATMIVTLPILFVYPFAQKFFIKGIMMGAVKG